MLAATSHASPADARSTGLPCLGARASHLCDRSGGGVGHRCSQGSRSAGHWVEMHFPPVSSAAHTLPQGRGWTPPWQMWLISRASVPKDGVFISLEPVVLCPRLY